MWQYLFFVCVSLSASELDTDLKFHSHNMLYNEISGLVQYEKEIFQSLSANAGISVSVSKRFIETFTNQLGLKLVFFDWANGEIRFYNNLFIPEKYSIWSALFIPTVNIKLFFDIFISFSIGWYENIYYFTSFIPFIRKADLYDEDFLVNFKFSKKIHEMLLALEIATFDEKEVFRLNNPSIRIYFSFPYNEMTLTFYARYKMLLGFGRIDEFMTGVSFSYKY